MAEEVKGQEEKGGSLRQMIESENDTLQKELYHKEDAEFDRSQDLGSGPQFFAHDARSRDERVIDELLLSAPRNQGYYLKIHKESSHMPGQWEFKLKVDNYEDWVDLEDEVAKLVKAWTAKMGARKWGSGVYKVTIWNEGGIRIQKKYPVNTFMIDAGEPEEALQPKTHLDGVQDAQEYVNNQLGQMKQLFEAIKTVTPPAVDVNQQMASLMQMFVSGRGEKKDSETNTTNLILGLVTAVLPAILGRNNDAPKESPTEVMMRMMTMLKDSKDFLGLGEKKDGLSTVLKELAAVGINPFQKEDTLETLAKVKTIAGTVSDMGMGGQVPVERPSIFEKLIEGLAPRIPEIFSNVKDMVQATATAQQTQIEAREKMIAQGQAPVPIARRPQTSYGAPVGPQPNRMGAGDAFSEEPERDPYGDYEHDPNQRRMVNPPPDSGMQASIAGGQRPGQARRNPIKAEPEIVTPQEQLTEKDFIGMHPVLARLYQVAANGDTSAYPEIYKVLVGIPGVTKILQSILDGESTTDEVVDMLAQWGGKPYNYPPFKVQLKHYLDGFVEWMKLNQEGSQLKGVCDKCEQIYWYETLENYNAEPDHRCDNQLSPSETCPGQVKLVEEEVNEETQETTKTNEPTQ